MQVHMVSPLKQKSLSTKLCFIFSHSNEIHTMCSSQHTVAFLSSNCEAIISQLQLWSYNNQSTFTQMSTAEHTSDHRDLPITS